MTESVQDTVQPIGKNICSPFALLPYVKHDLRVGSEIIDNTALHEKNPHLSVLPNKTYDYSNVEMIFRLRRLPGPPLEYLKPTQNHHRLPFV